MRRLVFFDDKLSFAKRLASRIGELPARGPEIRCFSDKMALLSYLRREDPDLIVISENLYEREIQLASTGRMLLLTEEKGREVPEGTEALYRYQEASALIAGIFAKDGSREGEGRIHLIGGPLAGRYDSSLYRTLGRLLGNNGRTLGIDLSYCPPIGGEEEMLSYGVSDAWLGYKEGRLEEELASCLRGEDFFFPLSPLRFPRDRHALRAEELPAFLRELLRVSGMRQLLVNQGESFPGEELLLRASDRIFLPFTEGGEDERRLLRYASNFAFSGDERVLSRMELLPVPDLRQGENLMWTPFAPKAERILKGEERADTLRELWESFGKGRLHEKAEHA